MNKLSTALFLIFSSYLLYFSITGKHGYTQLQKISQEVEKIKNKNSKILDNIAKVRNRIYDMKTSRAELERTAREELGLARSNEVIYIFSEKPTKENEKQKK